MGMARKKVGKSTTSSVQQPAKKRGRGRPRKVSASLSTSSGTQKRGRGRPRKTTQKLTPTAETSLINEVKKSCGRLIETPNTAISEQGKQQLRETLVDALCSTKTCSL